MFHIFLGLEDGSEQNAKPASKNPNSQGQGMKKEKQWTLPGGDKATK